MQQSQEAGKKKPMHQPMICLNLFYLVWYQGVSDTTYLCAEVLIPLGVKGTILQGIGMNRDRLQCPVIPSLQSEFISL